MAFAVTFVFTSALMPAMMIFFGRWLRDHAPPDINCGFGYRTKRSMASKETWDFANSTAGNYLVGLGKRCLPASVAAGVLVSVFVLASGIGERHQAFFIYGICALQVSALLSVIPYTERKLKIEFGQGKAADRGPAIDN